jgi:LemA protein
MNTLYIIVGIVALLVIIYVVFYNQFISLRNQVQESWAQIDVQLKRRADLIPNIIETVKGYASHERTVFQNVTAARSRLQNNLQSTTDGKMPSAEQIKELNDANNSLTGTLNHLFAVAENYPNLKASTNFSELTEELSNTENKISFARQNYNQVVKDLNTRIEKFPSSIVAGIHNIKHATYFEVENEQDKVAPKVDFN